MSLLMTLGDIEYLYSRLFKVKNKESKRKFNTEYLY